MVLHFNILDSNRQKVFQTLKAFQPEGVLAGGTALAIQINHRYSYDFDLFFEQEISDRLKVKCGKLFDIQDVLVTSVDEFTFLTEGNVKVTLLYYPFHFSGKRIPTPSISLLSVLNIAAGKAYALNQRGTYRDYVDLYWITTKCGISLKSIMSQSSKVHGELFSPKLFLGQLVYIDDLKQEDIQSVQFIGESVSAGVVEAFFKKEVAQFQKEHLR